MKQFFLFVIAILLSGFAASAQDSLYTVNYIPTDKTDENGNAYTAVEVEIDLSGIVDNAMMDIRAGKVPGSMDFYFFDMVKDTNLYHIPGITRVEGAEKAIIEMGNFVVVPDSFHVEVNWYEVGK